MALPEHNRNMNMEESVELSLAGLADYLQPGDMALVTAVRKAARAIDRLDEEAEFDPDANPAKSLQYHYMVTGGLEKLGGSVKARADIGLKPAEDKRSKLAAVRGIRDGSTSGQGGAQKQARRPRSKPANTKAS